MPNKIMAINSEKEYTTALKASTFLIFLVTKCGVKLTYKAYGKAMCELVRVLGQGG
jgi:hypothetical protein